MYDVDAFEYRENFGPTFSQNSERLQKTYPPALSTCRTAQSSSKPSAQHHHLPPNLNQPHFPLYNHYLKSTLKPFPKECSPAQLREKRAGVSHKVAN
jgi:hypothetical protein